MDRKNRRNGVRNMKEKGYRLVCEDIGCIVFEPIAERALGLGYEELTIFGSWDEVAAYKGL